MFRTKLNWKRPLFYLLLPIFLVMVFLGFPMPVAPPPATKFAQEQSDTVKKRNRKRNEAWMEKPDEQVDKRSEHE